MKIGDKVQFKYNPEHEQHNDFLTPGRLYTGRLVKQYGDRVVVRLLRGTVFITKGDIIPGKPVFKKPTAPTPAEYKLFSDTVFEMAVRWRDGWTSVISGKRFQKRDYAGLHGGHYKERGFWGSRHYPQNCFAITQGENHAMSRGCVSTIGKYRDFLVKKFGSAVLDEIEQKSKESPKLTVPYLKEDCEFCYDYLNNFCDANAELKLRVDKWPKAKRDKIYKVKEYLCL